METRLEDSLHNLRRANASLNAALATTPRTPIIVSAIVKNFEFNFELSWQAMRRLLAWHGVPTMSPRQAIGEAFRKGFIDGESDWLAMIADRNLTVHTYDEAFALEMAGRIEGRYMVLFNSFLERLTNETQTP